MSRFLTRLTAANTDADHAGGRGLWVLVAPLVYESDTVGQITVPAGFSTDFASVLRLPVMYALFGDKAHAAATVHDYLYCTAQLPRKTADAVFAEAIAASTNVSKPGRWAMWAAVRVFGGSHYVKDSVAEKSDE